MFKTAIAHSLELDSQDAIKDILEQCSEQLGDLMPQAGLLFAGIDHDFKLILDKINEIYPGIELIGCTTDGELSSVHGYTDDSIVLTLFSSDELYFNAGVADKISEDPVGSLKKAIQITKSSMDQEPDLCIVTPNTIKVLTEGFTTINIDFVIEGMKQALGETFPIFGGVPGDQYRFQGSYQFYNNNVFTEAAPFLFISGPLLFALGAESGWKPIGKKTKVTQADNETVYKIGDQTALEFYKHYLGNFDSMEVAEYPIAIFEKDEIRYYLRAPGFIDAEKGIMKFVGSVPEGATIQLTHATRDDIIAAVGKSVDSAAAKYPGTKPAMGLCFTCMARKMVLGTKVKEEYQVLKNQFPDLPVAGLYTYGEIGSLGEGKPARFHNETFLTLLLGVE